MHTKTSTSQMSSKTHTFTDLRPAFHGPDTRLTVHTLGLDPVDSPNPDFVMAALRVEGADPIYLSANELREWQRAFNAAVALLDECNRIDENGQVVR